MWFPMGRHPDSITYSRNRSPESGLRVVFRHLIGNGIDNTLTPWIWLAPARSVGTHHWLNKNRFTPKTDKDLRIEFVKLHNNSVGKPYCKELREYYGGLK